MLSCRKRNSPPKPAATPPPSTSAKSAPATSTTSPPRSTRTHPPSPWSDRPKRASSTNPRPQPFPASCPITFGPHRPPLGTKSDRATADFQGATPMNSFTDNFTINGVTLTAQPICRQNEVLTPDALAFVAKLHKATAERRQELLLARQERRQQIGKGQDPHFLPETEA